jgi:tetratricopeptide (TPR) repeat protein
VAQLTLALQARDTATPGQAAWFLDGTAAAAPFLPAGPPAADPARLFLELFEQRAQRPLVEDAALRHLGGRLFEQYFAPVWPVLGPRLQPAGHELILRSADRQLLNLPWELVELTPGLPVGCDAAWSLRRTPLPALVDDPAPLGGGPLRLLFVAAAPVDQPQLFYEREEDAIQRVASQLRGDVVLYFGDAGSFDELRALVARMRPHLVHLSGHGVVGKDGVGRFAFEDDRGRTDLRTAEDLLLHVFRGSPVRCVFLNACQSSQAAAAGLCQALVAAGLPLAVGWAASVADDRATDFAAALYNRLLHGEPVPVAVAHARAHIRGKGRTTTPGGVLQDATFVLPQVYASTRGSGLFDPAAPKEPYRGPRTERTLLVGGIKGLKEGFVGRRRQLQRLMPALRDGSKTFVVLTGLGGAGKSTLATRAVNQLQGEGFRVVSVRTRGSGDPAACGRQTLTDLVAGLEVAFIQEGRNDLREQLTDGKLPLEIRLRLVAAGLNDLRLALVLDNFEDALDLQRRTVADPDLALLYRTLAENVVRGSCVLLTCRYLPAETPVELPTVLHLPVPELEEHNFLKFLRGDDVVNERMKSGELSEEGLRNLFRQLGGTPRFLEAVRKVLRRASAEDLLAELSDEQAASAGLAADRERYLEGILVGRLFEALTAAARTVSCRLAVSLLPIPAEAVVGLAGLGLSQTESALADGVAYGLVQEFAERDLPTLYHVPGLLRSWLSGHLTADETRAAHAELARFWRASYDKDREKELRVLIDVELAVCREHARSADGRELFRWASVRLARRLERRTEWREAQALLEDIPEHEYDGETSLALAGVLTSLGSWKKARTLLERGLDLLPEDNAEKAATWHELATIDVHEGSYAAAREKFGRSLEIDQALGDRAGEAATWHSLATIDLKEGSYAAAREKFGRSLEMRQAIGDRAGAAATWHQLASIDLNEGSYAPAREKFGRALETHQAIGDRAGEATAWHNLATIDLRQGSYAAAREKFGRALEIKQAIGNRAGEAATWQQLANIDAHEGLYAAAREKFGRALETHQAIGDRAGEAAAWHNLASIDLRQGSYAAAREKFGRALEMRQAIGDRAGEAATFYQLGILLFRMGQREDAARLLAVCWMIDKAIGHGDAEQDLRQLLGLCTQLGYDENQVKALLREVAEAYGRDRGRSLLDAAFPTSAE